MHTDSEGSGTGSAGASGIGQLPPFVPGAYVALRLAEATKRSCQVDPVPSSEMSNWKTVP